MQARLRYDPLQTPSRVGAMSIERYPHTIYCIDTDYVSAGIACAYLVGDDEHYALIETGTGPSVEVMCDRILSMGIDLQQITAIIPTHAHLDHAGAAGHWMQLLPAATLCCHPAAARHLINPEKLEASARAVYGSAFDELYGELIPVPAARVRTLEHNEVYTLGQRELRSVHLRGHAKHHLCLWDETSRGWFTGDTFGICYSELQSGEWPIALPATTPTQFEPTWYIDSVTTIANSQPNWIYPTHYGRIPFDPRTAEQLIRQIEEYAEITASCEPHAKIEDITKRALLACLDETAATAAVQRLQADIALNAQGVQHRLASLRSN